MIQERHQASHWLLNSGGCKIMMNRTNVEGRKTPLSLPCLVRSEHPRVVLCGASILNACLRGEPWQIVVSPRDAVKILEQASRTCQRCLDRIESGLPPAVPRAMTGTRVAASTVNSALRLRYDCMILKYSWSNRAMKYVEPA